MTEAIKRWQAARPCIHVYFTQTSASWLNQVERWISSLIKRCIRHGTHRSARAMEKSVGDTTTTTTRSKPFVWTRTADDIFASIERF